MSQLDTDERAPRMHATKGRCVFTCLQHVVTAHDDHHWPSCPSGCGWLPSSASLRALWGKHRFLAGMDAARV